MASEVERRGIEPFVNSEAMEMFYSESDAFLFESAVWNRNRLKSRMRRWVRDRLNRFRAARGRGALKVLVIGDGPGFDSLEIARGGHRVTYHELPGFQEAFARRLFDIAGADVSVVTDRSEIHVESFDAVVCLDVLEHVDDPPAVARSVAGYVSAGGLFFVHAPFYMIHPAYPTHLRSNRRWSGRLSLYRDAGLELLDGEFGWCPLMFAKKPTSTDARSLRAPPLRLLAVHLAGAYLAMGRSWSLPFFPVHRLRVARGRWFGST